MKKVAIVLTCHNRKDKTVECIKNLKEQASTEKIDASFYICDDKSNDGTVQAILEVEPQVNVFSGSGELFWSKGMYEAMSLAIKTEHDYYLMVNDDTAFEPNALRLMLESYKRINVPCGIVGTMRSLSGECITYGGQRYIHKWKVGRSEIVKPSDEPIKCDIANWNCFLIPQEIIDKVGIIDRRYEHGLGDFDYSLMMREKGYTIYTAVGYIGRVDRNPLIGTYLDKSISTKKRIEKLLSKKGRPVKSEFHFYIKHYGLIGFIYCVYLYIRIYMDIFMHR